MTEFATNDKRYAQLAADITSLIARFRRHRRRNRLWALVLRVATVSLASSATVVLGLRLNESFTDTIRNIALVISALVTLLGAIDAFVDYRGLWIRETDTLARLFALKRDLEFFAAEPGVTELSTSQLGTFKNRLNEILLNDTARWLQLHAGDRQSERLPLSSASQSAESGHRSSRAQ